jgi:rSAM/selenodomain-associated transferase 1
MNARSGSTVFGIFVKEPVAGRVKTRLAADLGEHGAELAASLYRAFQSDLVDRFRDRFDERVLGYGPASADGFFEFLSAGDYRLWPQPDVDLGNRMVAFFKTAFANGAGRVVLIGSDSPTLPVSLLDDAFESLLANDLVLGPATDGGYVLIGQSQCFRPVFEGIRWSTNSVLAQTVLAAQSQSLSVELLNPWYDIDTAEDLRMLEGHIRAMDVAGQGQKLEATRLVLT